MARRKSRSIFQRLEAGNNREMPIPIREQRAAATPRAEDRKAKETGERETPPCRRVLCVVWDVHHARSGIFRSSLSLPLSRNYHYNQARDEIHRDMAFSFSDESREEERSKELSLEL